jgi:dihydrolipoamide dehydrogenase
MDRGRPVSEFDVVFIGGGSAAEASAPRLTEAGLEVLVLEPGDVGGECPFTACIPSKALLTPARALYEAAQSQGVSLPQVDAARVLELRDRVTSGGSDAGHVASLEAAGVHLSRSHGRISGTRAVELIEEGRTVHARRAVVVATGAAPVLPALPGMDSRRVGPAADLTTVQSIPDRLVILGAGVIGCELAQAFRLLGSEVTVLDLADRPVPAEEPEASRRIEQALERLGIRFRFSTSATGFVDTGDEVRIELGEGGSLVADHVLVAVGRRPRVSAIGLESVGIDPDDLETDEWLRVAGATDWLYAIGDVNGRAPYTHGANYQGAILTEYLLGDTSSGGARGDRDATPRVMFTVPNLAAVGTTEDQARERGIDVITSEWDLADTAAPYSHGHEHPGWAKLVFAASSRRLIGATFVSSDAGEMIHAATIAIIGEMTIESLRHAIAPFPTHSEVWTPLLAQVL